MYKFFFLILCPLILKAGYDVVVYRATPAGISAAIQLKRDNKHVVIIEPLERIGGMMTNGLGASDICNRRFIGGLAREFFKKVGQEYNQSISWNFEPKVALKVFKRMTSEIPIVRSDIQDVIVSDGKIIRVKLKSGSFLEARLFIDASYEGDLLAKAGVSYAVGRESKDEYGESYAGFRISKGREQITFNLPSRDRSGRLYFGVNSGQVVPPGQGDRKIMAYNFRLCLTSHGPNKVNFSKPSGYDRSKYFLHAKYIRMKPVRRINEILNLLPLPNQKFDLNNRGPFSTNLVGENWDYPEADGITRERIFKQHKLYLQGLLFFLANDHLVPASLRLQMKKYGLCRDEFRNNNNWPEQMYVRVARRMIGRYVMKQQDLQKGRRHWDSIATGTCPIESHIVQRLDLEGFVKVEGFVREYDFKPYSIPYRSITPRESEIKNLLVPVALSASYIAYSGIRMEPTFMMLGQSAAIAANLALDSNVNVQSISYSDLRQRIESAGIRIRF